MGARAYHKICRAEAAMGRSPGLVKDPRGVALLSVRRGHDSPARGLARRGANGEPRRQRDYAGAETVLPSRFCIMRVWSGAFVVVKEVARHILRRPVVGVAAAARTADGRWLLIRRRDTGEWALPGGTLEWGETLREACARELSEEAGVDGVQLGELVGVYSAPHRDRRFHAVTVVVRATVDAPTRPPMNPMEIAEARLFAEAELPRQLSHGMTAMLRDAQAGGAHWE